MRICVCHFFVVPLQPQKLQSQAALTDSVTIGRIMTYYCLWCATLGKIRSRTTSTPLLRSFSITAK